MSKDSEKGSQGKKTRRRKRVSGHDENEQQVIKKENVVEIERNYIEKSLLFIKHWIKANVKPVKMTVISVVGILTILFGYLILSNYP